MKVLIVSSASRGVQRISGVVLYLVLGLVLVAGVFLGGGAWALWVEHQESQSVGLQGVELKRQLLSQQQMVDRTLQESRWYLASLSRELGQMQGRMVRLESLGKRLVDMAELGDDEFNFEEVPAMGGPRARGGTIPASGDLVADMQKLSAQLENRFAQLEVMEKLLRKHELDGTLTPSGKPVAQGWISSRYGRRVDPFTGHREFHGGIDFAGRRGSQVVTVASGIVRFAGTRTGYGRLVEVDHGNGFVTRYGHNDSLLVRSGELVQKGQPLALMGSSGRSTGPHLHFEVIQNGKKVDPSRYLSANAVR